jgi:hypothetical protein
MNRRSLRALAAAALFFFTPTAEAHHGAAAYDLSSSTSLDATVTSFRWANPHGLIEFDTRRDDGALQHWTAETAGLTILLRAGWSKSALTPGARVTIVGHAAHNRSLTMILERVVFADGRVLNNFVPKDLSGVWMRNEPAATFSKTAPPAMTPWAEARFRANKPTIGPAAALDANDQTVQCFPPGLPYVLVVPVPFELVQTADRVIQLFEYNHNVRRIYTDGRGHPPDLSDTESAQWLGHSTGRWEDDTLVIDTVGFNDQTWLDRLGHPHTRNLRVVEQLRRRDVDTLVYVVTVDDPGAYAAPWRGEMVFVRRAGWDILEHHCLPADEEYSRYKERAWTP